MTRRRRRAEPALVVISWRDIPAQVTVTGIVGEAKGLLPSRFQKAIDKAATVAGKTDHLSYIGEWRRTTLPLDGQDPQAAVDALVSRLEQQHDREGLAALVRRGGLADPDPDPSAAAGTTPAADPATTPDQPVNTGDER
jgi:hypothetical protein